MTRAPSLHDLSLRDAVEASIARTPDKAAIVSIDGTIPYRALLDRDALASEPLRPIARWLDIAGEALGARDGTGRPGRNETRTVVMLPGVALSDRIVMLRALNAAVVHRAFSRDTISATGLPLDTAAGVLAALLPLIFGGTLHLVRSGDIEAIEPLIASGAINQAWYGSAELQAFERHERPLPVPSSTFRLLNCVGLPNDAVRARLRRWLGPERVSAENGDDLCGPTRRYPGLAGAGEPYDGASLAGAH